tara:strand:- start:539 stop:1615 length:1077 start_codon:yes stop_codon:yes gene_type:complete
MREQLEKINKHQLQKIIRTYNLQTHIRINQRKRDLINDMIKHLDYDEKEKKFKVKSQFINEPMPDKRVPYPKRDKKKIYPDRKIKPDKKPDKEERILEPDKEEQIFTKSSIISTPAQSITDLISRGNEREIQFNLRGFLLDNYTYPLSVREDPQIQKGLVESRAVALKKDANEKQNIPKYLQDEIKPNYYSDSDESDSDEEIKPKNYSGKELPIIPYNKNDEDIWDGGTGFFVAEKDPDRERGLRERVIKGINTQVSIMLLDKVYYATKKNGDGRNVYTRKDTKYVGRLIEEDDEYDSEGGVNFLIDEKGNELWRSQYLLGYTSSRTDSEDSDNRDSDDSDDSDNWGAINAEGGTYMY